MSCDPIAIRVQRVSKFYQIYRRPSDRLKQFAASAWARWRGQPATRLFQEFRALEDVSLEIQRGETVGLIGRNGSGKSTLLQLICGTLHPSQGQVAVDGTVAALLELGAGFNPEFTGVENVYLNASVLGLSHAQIQARWSQIESFADIGEFIHQPVKTYSSGMVVRLAFAVIAHVDADVLIIDEALAVGDVYFTQKCMRFLKAFMARGTVLFVSHDIAAVKALCNRVVWLEQGRIRAWGEPKEVCQAYLEAYFEAQQGKSLVGGPYAPSAAPLPPPAATPAVDVRRDLLLASALRNDLRVFAFDPQAAGLGQGGASLVQVELRHAAGGSLNWVTGGETVQLTIAAECHVGLKSPIIGFMVKDRLGQALFGDNTYLSHVDAPRPAEAGQTLRARFVFDMPILPVGDYSMIVTISEGSQEEHIHHHWIHDALVFKSITSSVCNGMMGIAMRQITLHAGPTGSV